MEGTYLNNISFKDLILQYLNFIMMLSFICLNTQLGKRRQNE